MNDFQYAEIVGQAAQRIEKVLREESLVKDFAGMKADEFFKKHGRVEDRK